MLSALRPDAALVVAYGHILRDEFIAVPRLGTLNLHASLLPKYRGASPIQAAVAAGSGRPGMTLMRIVRELDAGPVADAERVAISPLDTAADVEVEACPRRGRAVREGPSPARKGRTRVSGAGPGAGKLLPSPRQGRRRPGFLCAGRRARGPDQRALSLAGRAVGAGGTELRLGLADAMEGGAAGSPGTVLGSGPDGLLIAAGTGVLRVRRLQRPGGRMLPAPEFLRGFPVAAGTVIASRPMAALVAAQPFRR